MHAGEKSSRLRALNDPVIVCAADRNRLADSELRERFGRHRLVFRRILDRARRNDYRLPFHQAWNRRDGADGSGIR